jgi:hypothetical protein
MEIEENPKKKWKIDESPKKKGDRYELFSFLWL